MYDAKEDAEEKIRGKEKVYQDVVEAINFAKKALVETGVCKLICGDVQGSSEVAITIVAAIMYADLSHINRELRFKT